MISKKSFNADGITTRFLSDFIIRNEQYARPYVFIYDNTLPADGTGDVLQDGTTDQANWRYPDNIWKRGATTPKSEDLVPVDKWQVVDNSVLFFSAPLLASIVYLEVATTQTEFGDTLVAPSLSAALEAEANAAASANNAATSEANALSYKNSANTSANNAAISEANALSYKNSAASSSNSAYTYSINSQTSSNNAAASEANAAASEAHVVSISNGLDGSIGRLTSPLLDLPLKNSLSMKAGVGAVTFSRSTTGTYIDRYGVLKTAAIDEPRFERDGLLIEGSSTNIALYSEDETQWSAYRTTTSRDATVVNPYGVLDSIKVTGNGATGEHFIEKLASITSSTDTYTSSIFVKPVENDIIAFRIYFTGGTNTSSSTSITFSTLTATGTGTVTPLANGWYRVSVTGTDNASGNTLVRWRCYVDNGSDTSTSTASIYLLGGQIEKLPFASSYIPTTTAAVTRGKDSNMANYTSNMPSWSDTFTIHFEYDAIDFNNGVNNIAFCTGTVVNFINFSAIGTAVFSVQGRSCGASEAAVQNGSKITATSDGTTASIYVDGVLKSSIDIGTTVGTTTGIYIGSDAKSLQQVNTNIKNFKIFDVCLTPTEVSLLAGGAI